jgi:hypothetical protein
VSAQNATSLTIGVRNRSITIRMESDSTYADLIITMTTATARRTADRLTAMADILDAETVPVAEDQPSCEE